MSLSPLLLSLLVAGLSTALVIVTGLPLARWLCGRRDARARLVEALVTAPLVLPPVVIGYSLLVLFAPHGPLGSILRHLFGASLLFHWTGAVLASGVVAFPLLVRTARAALESIPRGYLETAATCGAPPGRAFYGIHLPLALPGVAAGAVLAFARGLGEFGATVIVAGNIPGRTQTLPLAIYQAIVTGDSAQAWRMVAAVVALAVVLLLLADRFQRRALGADRGRFLP